MQDQLNVVYQFVSKLVVIDENKMYIGSYINSLKKQFSLSKLPPSVVSKSQGRKDVCCGLVTLWKEFFRPLSTDIVENILHQLDKSIVHFHNTISEDNWFVEKQDYIYVQFITPFHLAAWTGTLDVLSFFKSQYPAIWGDYINYRDLLGNLPLHCCFFNADSWSNPLTLSVQLSTLLDTNYTSLNALGFSPLHIAAISNQPKAIVYLREQDIDLSIPVHFFAHDKVTEVIDTIDTVRDICRYQQSSFQTMGNDSMNSWRCSSCSSFLGGSLCSYEGSYEDHFNTPDSMQSSMLVRMPSTQSDLYELEGYSALHLALLTDAPYCAYLLLESVDDLFSPMKSSVKPLEVISLYSNALFSYFDTVQQQLLFSLLPKEWHSFHTPNQDLLQSTILNGIVSYNYFSVVKILSTNINLDAHYFSQLFSPLHIACVLLDETFIRLFIGYGANPQKVTSTGDTCLHLILKSQSKMRNELVRGNLLGLLIMSGCDPSIPDGKGFSPLYYAIRLNDLYAVSILLAYKADPCSCKGVPTGRNAFQEAIHIKNEDIVRLIFKYYPTLLNIPDARGHYPLYDVVMSRWLSLMVYLLNYTHPLSDKAIADLELAFHESNHAAIGDCVKKQISCINHTCTNLNRYCLNFFLPNSKVEKCQQCGKKFSLITVKRHCRRCGQILCTSCCQDDHDKTKDHICDKCRRFDGKEPSQPYLLRQFEDGIKSYLVKHPQV